MKKISDEQNILEIIVTITETTVVDISLGKGARGQWAKLSGKRNKGARGKGARNKGTSAKGMEEK